MPERAHVDRIEGDRAVLLLGSEGRETVSLPSRLLPEGTAEGSALDLTLTPATDTSTRSAIDGLMDDLFGASNS